MKNRVENEKKGIQMSENLMKNKRKKERHLLMF